jgi:hypothetical protein
VVLDVVVGAPREVARDLGPLVAERRVRADEGRVLLLRPMAVLDYRVQVIMPPGAEEGTANEDDASRESSFWENLFMRRDTACSDETSR